MQHLKPVDMLGHIQLGLNSLVGGLDRNADKHMPYWSIGFAEGELGAVSSLRRMGLVSRCRQSHPRYRHSGTHHRGMRG